MGQKTTVMDNDGWLPLPDDVRKALHVERATAFEAAETGPVWDKVTDAQLERFIEWANERDHKGRDKPLSEAKLREFFGDPSA